MCSIMYPASYVWQRFWININEIGHHSYINFGIIIGVRNNINRAKLICMVGLIKSKHCDTF